MTSLKFKPQNVSSVNTLSLSNKFEPLEQLSLNDHVNVIDSQEEKDVKNCVPETLPCTVDTGSMYQPNLISQAKIKPSDGNKNKMGH